MTSPGPDTGPALTPRRIAVLMGGRSAEREVSLKTGEQVARALTQRGHEVVRIDSADDAFIGELRRLAPDVVFVCLHGRYGEDGTIQGLLEILGLPYVGSGVLASALAMDKAMSKAVYEHAGVPTPPWAVVRRGEPVEADAIVAALGEKLAVKPANEGSAIGVTIVRDARELPGAIGTALEHFRVALIESFIPGAEVTVGVVGNDDPTVLPTLQVVPVNDFYDYESKYVPGMSRHLIPADVPEAARRESQRLALLAHDVLGCRGMSRTDLIITEDGRAYVLETNTIPGMTETSLLPDAARAAGIEFPSLCEMLVRLALEEHGAR